VSIKEDVPRVKISMDLTQSRDSMLHPPSPLDTELFDGSEPPLAAGVFGVTIDEAHDAFRVSYEFADPSQIESCFSALYSMDFTEIITERIGAFEIGVIELAGVGDPFEIRGIGNTFSIFGQCEEFLCITEGNRGPIMTKGADIEGADVAGKFAERAVVPQERLRSIRHMLVAKRSWFYRMKHGLPSLVSHDVFDKDRSSVTVALQVRLSRFRQDGMAQDPSGGARNRLEIPFELRSCEEFLH